MPRAWANWSALCGLATATMLSFPSVVFAGDDNVLAAVNAVSEGYPLRGELRVAASLEAA